MALHIDSSGKQMEIDLNIDAAINGVGGSPVVDYTFIGIGNVLGGYYECKRLSDGRILFYTEHDDPDFQGGSILLTKDESVHVVTRDEFNLKLIERAELNERDKARRMNMLFDQAERSLNSLLAYITELGYEAPGTKFAEYLQNAHRITGSQRTFEVELNGEKLLLAASELNQFKVISANPQLTFVCRVEVGAS